MYLATLALHNILRWIVLLLALVAVAQAWRGIATHKPWDTLDSIVGRSYSIVMTVQFVIGLLLYIFLSPLTRAAFADFGAAMKVGAMRFFAVEHLLLMTAALAFSHIGAAVSRKPMEDHSKYRRAAIWYTLSLLLILVGMPWDRALFPGLG